MKKYLITGGSGFIGRRLVPRLLESDAKIVLMGRESSDFSMFEDEEKVNIARGSMNDEKFVKKTVKGVDYVIHLAGYARNWSKDPEMFKKINIDASLLLAGAALEQNVKKMVHCSTIVALGPTGLEIQDETHEPDKDFTEYERTKAIAEREVLALAFKGLNVVAVNPTRVYGPGLMSEANSLTIMIKNYLKFKNYLVLGKGDGIAAYAYVEDVVDGILGALEKGRKGEKYILGGDNVSLLGFYKTIEKVSGKKALPLFVPRAMALVIAGFEETAAKTMGKYPLITRPWVDHFLAHWHYSSAKAKKELGYNPVSLEEGIRITIDWLKSEGYV